MSERPPPDRQRGAPAGSDPHSEAPPARASAAGPPHRVPVPPSPRAPAPWLMASTVALGSILLLGLLLAVLAPGRGAAPNAPPTLTFSNATVAGTTAFPPPVQGHTPGPIAYAEVPPMGGVHNAGWQNCGVYDAPVLNALAVHSLEHGAAWITYRPDLPADQVEALRSVTRSSGYRLLSPYPNLPSPIVVSAWGYQLPLQQAQDPRLASFLQQHERNPQGPEPGAPCTGGTGTPMP